MSISLINSITYYIKTNDDGKIIGTNILSNFQNNNYDILKFPLTIDVENCQINILSNLEFDKNIVNDDNNNDNIIFIINKNNVVIDCDNYIININNFDSSNKFNGITQNINNTLLIKNMNINIKDSILDSPDGWLLNNRSENVTIENIMLYSINVTIENKLLISNGDTIDEVFKNFNYNTTGSLGGILINNITFKKCINFLKIVESKDGGFCKYNCNNLKFLECHTYGDIISEYGGGLCGSNCSNILIDKCGSSGDILGYQSGGFLGSVCYNCDIKNSYTLGIILGKNTGGMCGFNDYNIKIFNSYIYSINRGEDSGILISHDNINSLEDNISLEILRKYNILLDNFYCPKEDWNTNDAQNILVNTPTFILESEKYYLENNVGNIWVCTGNADEENNKPYILNINRYNYERESVSLKYGESEYETSKIIIDDNNLSINKNYLSINSKLLKINYNNYLNSDTEIEKGDINDNYNISDDFKIKLNNFINVNDYKFDIYSRINLYSRNTIIINNGFNNLNNGKSNFYLNFKDDVVIINDVDKYYIYNEFYLEKTNNNPYYNIYVFNSRSKYKKYISSKNLVNNYELRKVDLVENIEEGVLVELLYSNDYSKYWLKIKDKDLFFYVNNAFTLSNGGGIVLIDEEAIDDLPQQEHIFYNWDVSKVYNFKLEEYNSLFLKKVDNNNYLYIYDNQINYISKNIELVDGKEISNQDYVLNINDSIKVEFIKINMNCYKIKLVDNNLYFEVLNNSLILKNDTEFVFKIDDLNIFINFEEKYNYISNINFFNYDIKKNVLILNLENQEGIYNENNNINQTKFLINKICNNEIDFTKGYINVNIDGGRNTDLVNINVGNYQLDIDSPYYNSNNFDITEYLKLNFNLLINSAKYLLKKGILNILLLNQEFKYGEIIKINQTLYKYENNNIILNKINKLNEVKIYFNNTDLIDYKLEANIYKLQFFHNELLNYNIKLNENFGNLIIKKSILNIFLNDLMYVKNTETNILKNNENYGYKLINSELYFNDKLELSMQFYNPISNTYSDEIPESLDYNKFKELTPNHYFNNLFLYTIVLKTLKINNEEINININGLNEKVQYESNNYIINIYNGNTYINNKCIELNDNNTIDENILPIIINNSKNLKIKLNTELNLNSNDENIILLNNSNLDLDLNNKEIIIDVNNYHGLVQNLGENNNLKIKNANIKILNDIKNRHGILLTNNKLLDIESDYNYIDNTNISNSNMLLNFLNINNNNNNNFIENNYLFENCIIEKNNYFNDDTYSDIALETITGNGSNGRINIDVSSSLIKSIIVSNSGENYQVGDKLLIPSGSLGENSKELLLTLPNNSINNSGLDFNNFNILNTFTRKIDGGNLNMKGDYIFNYNNLDKSATFNLSIDLNILITIKITDNSNGSGYNVDDLVNIELKRGNINIANINFTLSAEDANIINNNNTSGVITLNKENIIINKYEINDNEYEYDVSGLYLDYEITTENGSGGIINIELMSENILDSIIITEQQGIYKEDEIIKINLDKIPEHNKKIENGYEILFVVNNDMLNGSNLELSNNSLELEANKTFGLFSGGICGYRSGVGNNNLELKNCVVKLNIDSDNCGGLVSSDLALFESDVIIENCKFEGNIYSNNCGGIVGSNYLDTTSKLIIKDCIVKGNIIGNNNGCIVGSKNSEIYSNTENLISNFVLENNSIFCEISNKSGGIFGTINFIIDEGELIELFNNFQNNNNEKLVFEYNLNFISRIINNFIFSKYNNNLYRYFGSINGLDSLLNFFSLLDEDKYYIKINGKIVQKYDLNLIDNFINNNYNFSYKDNDNPLIWKDKYTYNNLIIKTLPKFNLSGELLDPFGIKWTKINFNLEEPWKQSSYNLNKKYLENVDIIGNVNFKIDSLNIQNSLKYEIKNILSNNNNDIINIKKFITIDENTGIITVNKNIKNTNYKVYVYTSIINSEYYNYTLLNIMKMKKTVNLNYHTKSNQKLSITLPELDITNYEYIIIDNSNKGLMIQKDKNKFIYVYNSTSNYNKDKDLIKYKYIIKGRHISSNISEILININ